MLTLRLDMTLLSGSLTLNQLNSSSMRLASLAQNQPARNSPSVRNDCLAANLRDLFNKIHFLFFQKASKPADTPPVPQTLGPAPRGSVCRSLVAWSHVASRDLRRDSVKPVGAQVVNQGSLMGEENRIYSCLFYLVWIKVSSMD